MENNSSSFDESLKLDNSVFKGLIDQIPINESTLGYFDQKIRKQISLKKDIYRESNRPHPFQKSAQNKSFEENQYRKNNRREKLKSKFDSLQVHSFTGLQQNLDSKDQHLSDSSNETDNDPSDEPFITKEERLKRRLQKKINSLMAKRRALGPKEILERKRNKRKQANAKALLKKQERINLVKPVSASSLIKSKNDLESVKPVYNKEQKTIFSKFELSESGDKKKAPIGKNYKKLLKIAEKKQEETNSSKTAKDKALWKSAIEKAEGIKQKDNVELLKKSIKRRDKAKDVSTKKWKERTEKVEKKQKERQVKRQKNIKNRKQAKMDKKIKIAKKKGRYTKGL